MTTIGPAPAFEIGVSQLLEVGENPLTAFLCCGWAVNVIDVTPVADD